jgi:hypothetical protein
LATPGFKRGDFHADNLTAKNAESAEMKRSAAVPPGQPQHWQLERATDLVTLRRLVCDTAALQLRQLIAKAVMQI